MVNKPMWTDIRITVHLASLGWEGWYIGKSGDFENQAEVFLLTCFIQAILDTKRMIKSSGYKCPGERA